MQVKDVLLLGLCSGAEFGEVEVGAAIVCRCRAVRTSAAALGGSPVLLWLTLGGAMELLRWEEGPQQPPVHRAGG